MADDGAVATLAEREEVMSAEKAEAATESLASATESASQASIVAGDADFELDFDADANGRAAAAAVAPEAKAVAVDDVTSGGMTTSRRALRAAKDGFDDGSCMVGGARCCSCCG